MTAGGPDLLALHTTEPVGAIAVRCRGRVHEARFATHGQHAPAVLAEVQRLLREAGAALGDLTGIAVTTGPGSFTGIRVGLATAQGLAAARGWRVACCDSLLAVAAAQRLRGARGWLAVIQDARRGEVYAALYDLQAAPPRALAGPFCDAPEEATRRIEAAAGAAGNGVAEALRVVGSGARLVVAPLQERAEPESDADAFPGAASGLLELARAGACREAEPHRVEPTYYRKSDAEARREAIPPLG